MIRQQQKIAVVLSAIGLYFIFTVGCARGAMSAYFVERNNPGEVDMLHLVESPPGHLAGSLVISALNTDGSRKTDTVSDVSGTMTGSNISLQLNSSIAGWAQFFGNPTNLVGTLNGEVLTLSFGNQTLRFHEMSPKKYDAVLDQMNTVGKHIAMLTQAEKSLRASISDGRSLNTDLKNYLSWGQKRIAHVSTLHQWYAGRISHYSKCLQTIRPLAASKVASWQWQDCVLTIENDKYYRDEMAQSVRDADAQNTRTARSLDSEIAVVQKKFPQALDALNSACPYAKDVHQCVDSVQKLKSYTPNGALDPSLIAQFRAMVPNVSTAVAQDVQTSSAGDNRLSNLAKQIQTVYQSAQ